MTNRYRWLLLRFYQYVASHVRGYHGRHMRRWIASRLFQECGVSVCIEQNVDFGDGSLIRIGDYSGLGEGCRIFGPAVIGKYVMVGQLVMVFHRNHCFEDTGTPIPLQGYGPERTLEICDDVWVGAGSVITPRCRRIGKGAIVGAGSVVTHDVPDYAVVGGNPARLLRQRTLTHDPAGEAKLSLPSGVYLR